MSDPKILVLLKKAQGSLFGPKVPIKAHSRVTKKGTIAHVQQHLARRKKASASVKRTPFKHDPLEVPGDTRPTAVALFDGAGGLNFGFTQAGFRTVGSVEMNRDAVATLNVMKSRGALSGQVNASNADHLDYRSVRGVDVVIAGPPCQPFSAASSAPKGIEDLRDGWPIVLRAMEEIRPRYLCAENVSRLMGKNFRSYRATIAQELQRLGYATQWVEVNAADYGVPQTRKRVFLLATREGEPPFRPPRPTHFDPNLGASIFGDQKPWETALDIIERHELETAEGPGLKDPIPSALAPNWLRKHRPISLGEEPMSTVIAKHSAGSVHMVKVPDKRVGASVRVYDDPGWGPTDETLGMWRMALDNWVEGRSEPTAEDLTAFYARYPEAKGMTFEKAREEVTEAYLSSWGREWMSGTVEYDNWGMLDVDFGEEHGVEPWAREVVVADDTRIVRAPTSWRHAWQGFPLQWDFQGSATAVDRQIGNAVPPLLGESFARQINPAAPEIPTSYDGSTVLDATIRYDQAGYGRRPV